MDCYQRTLQRTKGLIAEFVNPKYRDASKAAFKSATRLECMMQDFPKEAGADAKVGFTVINQVRPLKWWDLVGGLCCGAGSTSGHGDAGW